MEQHLACLHCDQLIFISKLTKTESAYCPVCRTKLKSNKQNAQQKVVALSLSSIILLLSSLFYPFISFSEKGLMQSITLLDAADILFTFHYPLLGLLIDFSIIFLPLSLLFILILVHIGLLKVVPKKYAALLLKTLFNLFPLVMCEIFLIGILISMIKIMSMADIQFGVSFYSFCLFVICYLKCISYIDKSYLWQQISTTKQIPLLVKPTRAIEISYNNCHVCHQLTQSNVCSRCNSKTYLRDNANIQKVFALLITSLLFYIPANIYPIMHTWVLNQNEPATILTGILALWEMGSYPIAVIIFIASVVIPLIKMFALALLCYVARYAKTFDRYQYTKMYRITEFIGKWSMLDVFVVIVLVSLVQLDVFMSIKPGIGALFFAAMVFTSMLSAHVFDPRLLWDRKLTLQDK